MDILNKPKPQPKKEEKKKGKDHVVQHVYIDEQSKELESKSLGV
jgi:hypothetical protein